MMNRPSNSPTTSSTNRSPSRLFTRALAPVVPFAMAVAATAILGACTGEQGGATKTTGEPSVQAGDSAAGANSGGMQGMQGMHDGDSAGGTMGGMSGMAGMMGGMGPEMQAHMRQMMGGMSGEQMNAMLPTHRQMVANMLSRMNGEMRQMNMAADAGWTAITDSVRQDLVRLPELSPAELKSTMPAHMARVRRLAEMHQGMMQNMKR